MKNKKLFGMIFPDISLATSGTVSRRDGNRQIVRCDRYSFYLASQGYYRLRRLPLTSENP